MKSDMKVSRCQSSATNCWRLLAYPAWVCVLSTANWECMHRHNFEASGGTSVWMSKFAREGADEMKEKRLLYRLASWPNLTQLAFLSSIPLGGAAWLEGMVEQYPQ